MFSIVMVLVVTTVIGTVIAVNVSVDADKPLHNIMDYVKQKKLGILAEFFLF